MSDDQIQPRDGGDESEERYDPADDADEDDQDQAEEEFESADEPEEQAREVYQTPQGYYPSQPAAPQGDVTDEEAEYLRAAFGEEVFDRLERRMWARIQQHGQYMDANSVLSRREEAEAPEWYRTYGGASAHYLSQMAPQVRSTEQGVRSARLAVLFDEAERAGGTPEAYAEAMMRHARLLRGQKAQNQQKAPLPVPERVPGSSSSGTSRPRENPQGQNRASSGARRRPSSVAERMAERLGKGNFTNLIEEGKE